MHKVERGVALPTNNYVCQHELVSMAKVWMLN